MNTYLNVLSKRQAESLQTDRLNKYLKQWGFHDKRDITRLVFCNCGMGYGEGDCKCVRMCSED